MTHVSKNKKKEKVIKFPFLTNMNHESDKASLLAEEITSEELWSKCRAKEIKIKDELGLWAPGVINGWEWERKRPSHWI